MSKTKMTLQQFADRHGLQVNGYAIRGPRGQICRLYVTWIYRRGHSPYYEFNPITEAEWAIKAIGLKSMAPPKPTKRSQSGSDREKGRRVVYR
jgi:hypothetical protein